MNLVLSMAFLLPSVGVEGNRCTGWLHEVGGASSGQDCPDALVLDIVLVGLSLAKPPMPEATCSYTRPQLCSLPAPCSKMVRDGVVLASDCSHHPPVQTHTWKPEGDRSIPENNP